MILLVGRSCSGKDTILEELASLGIERVVPYTTRPMRGGEIDGVTYHFTTDIAFRELQRKGFFACTSQFTLATGQTVNYGIPLSDLNDCRASIVDPHELSQIIKFRHFHPVVVHIIASNRIIMQRMKKRGDNAAEASRRIDNDAEDFNDINKYVDIAFRNDGQLPVHTIAEMILDTHNRIISEMANSAIEIGIL